MPLFFFNYLLFMNIWFRVRHGDASVPPASFSCLSAPTTTDKATVGLLLEVNGATLANFAVGAMNNGSSGTVTVGGVSATFNFQNTDYYHLNINLGSDTSATVKVKVTKTDYNTYDETFRVENLDIGLNPNNATHVGILLPFDVELIPRIFQGNTSAPVDVQCPKAFVWRSLLTNVIHLIKRTSSPGNTTYFKGGTTEYLASGPVADTANVLGMTEVNMRLTGTDGVGITAIVPLPTPFSIHPEVGFSVVNGSCNECTCIQTGSNVLVTISGDHLTPYVVESVLYYYRYNAADAIVELFDLTTNTLESDLPMYTAQPQTTPFVNDSDTFPIPAIVVDRLFKLKVTIAGEEDQVYEITLIPCAYEELTRDGCGSFQWTNKGEVATLTVKKVASTGAMTTVATNVDVPIGDIVDLVLDDGVYLLVVTRASVEVYSYKVFSTCSLVNCIAKFTKELACSDPCDAPCDCDDCVGKDKVYDVSAFMLLTMTYMSLLNNIYKTSYVFINLGTAELITLSDLSLIIERMKRYCNGCS